MIESEEFSFFFQKSCNAIHDFCRDIFSVEIIFSHIAIVIGMTSNLGDETRIDGRSEDICPREESLGPVRSESDGHTGYTDDISFFLHTARVGHHTSRLGDHIHYLVMMCERWSVGKIFTIFESECLNIFPQSITVDGCFGRIQSQKADWIPI